MKRALPLLKQLYKIVDKLEDLFPGRRFTPDGHMVGSIGEVWASRMFGLTLLRASAETHDAKARDGRLVQIKATQGNRAVAMYGRPQHLVVLKLSRTGEAAVVYNGPGAPAWRAAGKKAKNGQRTISLTKLRALQERVPVADRLRLSRA